MSRWLLLRWCWGRVKQKHRVRRAAEEDLVAIHGISTLLHGARVLSCHAEPLPLRHFELGDEEQFESDGVEGPSCGFLSIIRGGLPIRLMTCLVDPLLRKCA